MNLLIDPWVPVKHGELFCHVTYEDILCRDEDWRISLPRDDMELGALQLLISLTQAIFPPLDKKELKDRISAPLNADVFSSKTGPFLEWFDLLHSKTPFMQTPDTMAKEITPIQKLFIGLPEGNNHAFFNGTGEISLACPGCAAVALFNQATNCPSFGGGFKAGLRGNAPITTLVGEKSLRATIWYNVVSREILNAALPDDPSPDVPVWVQPLMRDEVILLQHIGLIRGLFWQPCHIKILWENSPSVCDLCGGKADGLAFGFRKEKFTYNLMDEALKWPHPHSPRRWEMKEDKKEEKFASFTTTTPTWTQLTTMLIRKEDKERQGQTPALVVSQYREVFRGRKLNLIVGGYRNNKASVLERRHELFSLPEGWDTNSDDWEECINEALAIKDLLRKKTYGLSKAIGVGGLANEAETLFYQDSESLIHEVLRALDWREAAQVRDGLQKRLIDLAKRIFEEIARPYLHDPKLIKAVAKSRRSLWAELAKRRSVK